MDCRRSAVDDVRSRRWVVDDDRYPWEVDEDRRRRRSTIEEDRRRRRRAIDDDRRRRRWEVNDYPPLELPLKWRDPPPEYPPLELPLKWRNPLPDHLVRNSPPLRPHSAASAVHYGLYPSRSSSRRPDADSVPDLYPLDDSDSTDAGKADKPRRASSTAEIGPPPPTRTNLSQSQIRSPPARPTPLQPSEPAPPPSLLPLVRFRDSPPDETTVDTTPPSPLSHPPSCVTSARHYRSNRAPPLSQMTNADRDQTPDGHTSSTPSLNQPNPTPLMAFPLPLRHANNESASGDERDPVPGDERDPAPGDERDPAPGDERDPLPDIQPSPVACDFSSDSSSLPIPDEATAAVIVQTHDFAPTFASSHVQNDDSDFRQCDSGPNTSPLPLPVPLSSAARHRQEEEFKEDRHLLVSSFALIEDPLSPADSDTESSSGDDLFGHIDRAISLKRQILVKKGLLPPNAWKNKNNAPLVDSIDEVLPEEFIDLEEIEELHGLTVIPNDEIQEENPVKMLEEEKVAAALYDPPSLELDLESLGKSRSQILEPKCNMMLAELPDESQVVPLFVYRNLEVCDGFTDAEMNTNDVEVCGKIVGSSIRNVFTAGVKMSCLSFTCKTDLIQCLQAVRHNVTDEFDPKFVGPGEEAVGLVHKKFMYSNNEDVGIVLLATEKDKNDLQKDVGGYLHVVVLHDIQVIDDVTVDELREVSKGTSNGDFPDAIVVGMDMLLKKFGPTNKGKHGLSLLTDPQHLVEEPDEGCKADKAITIGQLKKSHGELLDCIIVKVKLARLVQPKSAYENIGLLNHFSKNTIYKIIYEDGPTSLSGDLELHSIMKIMVWVYPNTLADRYKRCKIFDPGIYFLHLHSFLYRVSMEPSSFNTRGE